MANVSSSNGLEKRPRLAFRNTDGSHFPCWRQTSLGCIIEPYSEKVYGEHDYEVLTSAREGLQRQEDHFGSKQRHDTDGYNIIPFGYCTYRNRSDDGKFAFNINTISEKAIVSKFYPVFRFTNANSTFMAEFLNSSPRVKKKLSVLAVGTSQVVLSFEALKAAKFDLPCKDEQDKIAAFLECLNTRIENQRTLVAALKKYKRGVVCKVFSEIERECNTVRLGDCVSILRGGSPRPIDAYITDDPDGINWIKIGDTFADELYITRTREKIIPSGAKKSRRVFQGDLILSNSMSFGRPYILQIDGCIHDGWLLIRDEDNVFEKRFLCYYLGSDNVIAQYKRFAAGSCVNNLNSELVGNVEICCPPRSTQQEIAEMLTVLDSRIAHANRIYEALLRMRTSLLQQLFI